MVTYDLGNIADWLSGIGTIAAVITALYLSKKETKPRARVFASYSYAVFGSELSREPFRINAKIVNQGLVPIHITECTIKFGKERLNYIDGSTNVDKLLGPGEYYEHSLLFEPLKRLLVSKNIRSYKTKIYFLDASGKRYNAKINLHY
ncbi:hypothetical protein J7E42_03470 [Bacillus sp. ISL-37]|nr:hypothetical protein [Bacillus sp. ISL-37]